MRVLDRLAGQMVDDWIKLLPDPVRIMPERMDAFQDYHGAISVIRIITAPREIGDAVACAWRGGASEFERGPALRLRVGPSSRGVA